MYGITKEDILAIDEKLEYQKKFIPDYAIEKVHS